MTEARREQEVALCERVHADWIRLRAERLGGGTWTDGDLRWAAGPDGAALLFPDAAEPAALEAGIAEARARGCRSLRVWTRPGVAEQAFRQVRLREDWAPWWMTSPLDAVPAPAVPVRFESDDALYGPPFEDYRPNLRLARLRPTVAWHAVVRDPASGGFAGRGWAYADGEAAGIFDVAVWERFQRSGFGRALVAALCAVARDAGATRAVLNATPEGERLYAACGFARVGTGATWFRRLRPA